LAELLLLAEHAYNTAVSETTKTSPFFANYGHQPETQPEIAIEHYRESRIPGRRLNEREKRMEYLVFWKGHPPKEATWEPWENLEGDEAVEALVKEFHQKYPQAVKDRRVSLEWARSVADFRRVRLRLRSGYASLGSAGRERLRLLRALGVRHRRL
jgi:hypothetical protein